MRLKVKTAANTPTPGNPRVGSQDRMLDVMTAVLNEKDTKHTFHKMKPERIVGARLVTYNSDGDRALKPFHRLRVYSHKYPVNTIVGHLTEGHFRGMIRASLLTFINDLNRNQPGQWRVVAARPVDDYKSRWSRVATGNAATTDVMSDSIQTERAVGASNNQRTKPVMIQEPYIRLEVVFAELSDAPLRDHEYNRSGRQNGKHYRYSQTGLLKDMHQSLRDVRKLAIEIVNEAYDGNFENIELSENDIVKIGHMSASGISTERLAHIYSISEERVEQALQEAQERELEAQLLLEAQEKSATGKEASA